MEILHRQFLSKKIVDKCSSVSNTLWICSPYIGGIQSISGILGKQYRTRKRMNLKLLVDISNPSNCDFVTLNHLIDFGFEVRSLPGLHAKIYIFDSECMVTSANLTDRAFTKKSEAGVFLNSKEAPKAISIFETFFKDGKQIKRFSEKQIREQRRKTPHPGEQKSGETSEQFYDIPNENIGDYAAWLKIEGDSKDRKYIFDNRHFVNDGYHGCKRSKNGPRLRRNDMVILSRLGHNHKKDENDLFIYGIGKVDIPFNKNKDLLKYKKRININKYHLIKRWGQGFWIKDIRIIKGDSENDIWIKEFKDTQGKQIIDSTSIMQQSHIKLDKKQFDFILSKLENKFSYFGEYTNKNPKGIWINRYIKGVSKLRKSNFKIK